MTSLESKARSFLLVLVFEMFARNVAELSTEVGSWKSALSPKARSRPLQKNVQLKKHAGK